MQTLEKFLAGSDLKLRYRQISLNGDGAPLDGARRTATRYRCELRGLNGARPVTTIIDTDDGPPDMSEVLDAVAAEAAVVEAAACYEAWAVQMGFDPDSRSGERVYRATRRQGNALRRLIGEEAYEALLWETERL
jgi:hypothetical protein